MKLKPYMIIGILFIVVFIGISLIGQAIGFWHLPGQNPETEQSGTQHSEGENHEEPATVETELHGYMNLKEFLTKNGVDLECVASKLGVTVEELNIEAKEIAHGKGFEMEQIQEFAKECKSQTQAPIKDNNTASVTEKTEPSSNKNTNSQEKPKTYEGKSTTQVIEDLEKGQPKSPEEMKKIIEEAREKGEQLPPPDQPSLPFLKGSDMLDKYCIDNNINMECLSKKLGIPVSEFSKTAKEVAAKLSTGHVEQIREVLPGCVDYSR